MRKKHFDNLNWNFLFQIIDKLALGRKFSNVIRKIYKIQPANIIINDVISGKFQVRKELVKAALYFPFCFS